MGGSRKLKKMEYLNETMPWIIIPGLTRIISPTIIPAISTPH